MISTFKKITLAGLVFSALTFSVHAQNATVWKLDKAHTSVNFSINHFFSAVTGRFTKFDGDFRFDPNNLAGSKVSFTIPVSGINTDDGKRDSHLLTPDFFDEKNHKNISFVSERIEKTGDKVFVAHGKLTMHGTTREVSLPFKITGEMEHPMMKGTLILGISLNTTLNRTAYGVGTGSWAATMVVGDEVNVNINMELNRVK